MLCTLRLKSKYEDAIVVADVDSELRTREGGVSKLIKLHHFNICRCHDSCE